MKPLVIVWSFSTNMIFSPSKLLIIFLALLQLIAPFVHAHTGDELANQGIHLHELEHYSFTQNEIIVQAMNHNGFTECSVISVGSGIQTKKIATDNSSQFYLLAKHSFLRKIIPTPQLFYYFSYYPPPSVDINRLFLTRAPPVYTPS